MNARRATIISTGIANTASVAAALRRCGCEVALSADPGEVERAGCVVLPGVGAFGAGMRLLNESGLAEIMRARVRDGRPTLAVCLGMQLLCASSEESPGAEGLGIVDARAERFPAGVRTPQFGWNRVEPDPSCAMIEPGYAYFANSFRIRRPPMGWRTASSDHGGRFVAAMERGRVLACQFHPELSGRWGLRLLERWLVRSARKEPSPC